ncbi:hypothetical protein V6N12_048015 [Hibiscus sabdariffa]|uniref:TF-B3 domain-containing protein n=1 Tax=Hibiscus sabdariffa TaxID=183260 RepID=A0ABR2CUN0_9ROSI
MEDHTKGLTAAMANAEFTPTTPHFFQPLLPGFQHHLTIPLLFFKHYLKSEINSQRAVLRSHGRTWSVRIRDRRFEDGWGDFAKDHDLHVGDFLVFEYGGNLVFDVVVLDTSACQREYPLSATKPKHQNKSSTKESTERFIGKLDEKRASTSISHGSPHFVAALNPDSLKRFILVSIYVTTNSWLQAFQMLSQFTFRIVRVQNIPREFARSNGLVGRCCDTVVVDEQRRSWNVSLQHKESEDQLYLGCGWRDICIRNDLNETDRVSLELIGNGITPVFKLHKVASDSDVKRMPDHPNSNAGCFRSAPSSLE